MKLFVQGKVSSTSNKNIEFKVDESTCMGYAQHLDFLETKAKKRAEQGNALPNISWTDEKTVKALMTKQLKLY